MLEARLAVQVNAHDIIASLRERLAAPSRTRSRPQDERPLGVFTCACVVSAGDIIADIG